MYVDYLHFLYASVHLQGCSHLQWRLFRSPHNVSVGASVVGCSQAWSQWDHRVGKRALPEIVASQEDQIQSVVFYTDTFDFLISCVLHVSLGLPEWEILMLSLPEANVSQKKLSQVMHCAILSVLMIDLMFKRHTGYLSWFILQHSLADPCSILHPWDAQLLQTWPGDCPVWGLCLWPSMVQPPTSQQRLRKFVNGLSSVVPFCYFVIFRPASKELNLMFCFCPVFPGFHRHFNVWAWVGIEKHAVWYQFKALETCFKRRAVAPVPKVHQKGLVLAVLQGKHQNTDENYLQYIRHHSKE